MKKRTVPESQVSSEIINQMINNEKNNLTSTMETNLNRQDLVFDFAKSKHEEVRHFISNPEKLLGRDITKHGELAEKMEVGIRNAREIMDKDLILNSKNTLSATFENVGSTAPEDYLIDGIAVQSKYINGANPTLTHVLNHQ